MHGLIAGGRRAGRRLITGCGRTLLRLTTGSRWTLLRLIAGSGRTLLRLRAGGRSSSLAAGISSLELSKGSVIHHLQAPRFPRKGLSNSGKIVPTFNALSN